MDRGLGKKTKKEALKVLNMPTTNHLLVIGINDYRNEIPKLNNAVRDAKTVEALLRERYDFKEENIIALYEQDATKDNILDAFLTIIRKLSDDDNLIFYFSGHGELIKETNRGYWIPIEARANKRGSYLNTIEITDFVKACKARHILGIVDACYSGTLLREMPNDDLTKYFTLPSRKIMTSGLIEPVPDGQPNTHSPFASALLNALKYNDKPYLSSDDLWYKMKASLASNSSATAQFQVMHDAGHHGGDFFFLSANSNEIPNAGKVKKTEELQASNQTRELNPETPSPPPAKLKQEDLASLSVSEWKIKLKRMATTHLKRALTKAEDRIDTSSDAFNSLLLLQSRYHSSKKSQDAGLVTDQQSEISFNRIKAAFSGFLDDLEDYDMK